MESRKSVLITGASTGIGRRIVERLAADGHRVYAGARKDNDLRSLGLIRNVEALRLDVTDAQDVAAAVSFVASTGGVLHGLVNNAGVATFGAVIDCEEYELDLVMSVNVRGPYRITRAFAPLIMSSTGRIVMVGSISGVLAEQNMSAYSMSKHALEALTDCLAMEMAHFGVQVSIIEPGAFKSELCNTMARRTGIDSCLPDLSKCSEPDEAVASVVRALFEPRPKRRYLVAQNEAEADRTLKKQIEQLVQLNEDHAHSYSRAQLIGMLDAALVQTRAQIDCKTC